MRDPDLMLKLLREMSDAEMGRKTVLRTYGMSEAEQAERHHLELLVDAGHAKWIESGKHTARMTNDGYDFLSAIDRGKGTKAKFTELFNDGVPYVKAALEIVKMVSAQP